MTVLDPTTLPQAQLISMLRDCASGVPNEEAAVELVVSHAAWLRRDDFLTECVVAVDHGMVGGRSGVPIAAISWHRAAGFADGAPASTSETNILRLACSLGGVSTGPLRDLTAALDPANTARVLDALAHGAGWHERGINHTVDGRQDRAGGPSLSA